MRKVNRIAAAAVLAISSVATFGVTSASAAGVAGGISIQGTCDDDYDIVTSGAQARASLWCYKGKIYIDGWVKDTAADGQCAEVYGNVGDNKFRSPLACPKDNKDYFSFNGKGSTANVYLREF